MEITWCLKITEKVALSIASEVRYVYIHFEGIKLKMPKFKCDILSNFQTFCRMKNEMSRDGLKSADDSCGYDLLASFESIFVGKPAEVRLC